MTFSRRALALGATAALLAAGLPGAALAAGTKSVAYFMPGDGTTTAYLIDWQARSRARVVSGQGAQAGSVADNGTQKLVTLDGPLSNTYDTYDSCDNFIQQRQDTLQMVVRDLPGGVSQIVEIGTITNLGGCEDGLVTPFGTPDDAGASKKRLSMSARPSVADLVPGSQIAGPSEEAWAPGDMATAQDVVTLGAGTATFQASGHSVPAAFSPDQWLVFSLPGFQRAYTRVEVDARTGGETWLRADWAAGAPTRVESALFVKPAGGAGFGTAAQAARMWDSGIFIATRKPFFFYLYKTGTGERVQKDLDLGTEWRTPIAAWWLDGGNLWQQRLLGGGTIQRNRTWVPLRNEGSKTHWVMESEVQVDGSDVTTVIKPRVNYYLDTGKAVPPAVQASRAGMVYLGGKPALAR